MPDPTIQPTVTVWRRDRAWQLGVFECPKVEVAGHEGWAWPGGIRWSNVGADLVHLLAAERTLLSLGGEPMRVAGVLVCQDEPTGSVAVLVEVAPWPG